MDERDWISDFAAGVSPMLGERPHAYRAMLVNDGGGSVTPTAPTTKPKPAKQPKKDAKKPPAAKPAPAAAAQAKAGAAHAKPKKIAGDTNGDGTLSTAEEFAFIKTQAARDQVKAEQDRTDGKKLDTKVPKPDREDRQQAQKKLQKKLNAAAATAKPPKGLSAQAMKMWRLDVGADVQAASRAKILKLQERYWSKHDTYVDDDGTVYAAKFNSATGKVELKRRDTVKTRPPKAVTDEAKASQHKLEQRIARQQKQARADREAALAKLPPQIRNFERRDFDPAAADASVRARNEAGYYSKHKLHVGEDGTVSTASVDPHSGAVTFTEQPDKVHLTRKQRIASDGSRTRTATARARLSNGTDVSTRSEDVDRHGRVRETRTKHTRDTRTGNVHTVASESATFGASGRQTQGHSTLRIEDGDAHRTTVSATSDTYRKGRLATRHNQTDVTGDGPQPGTHLEAHATTDARYNHAGAAVWVHATSDTTISGTDKGQDDNPDREWSQREHIDSTIDGHGRSIYRRDGSLAVVPKTSLERTLTTREKGSGQDDDTDLVTTTTSRAHSDASGDLVFDQYSHTRETSEGKDGARGREWDTPINAETGESIDTPPDGWHAPGTYAPQSTAANTAFPSRMPIDPALAATFQQAAEHERTRSWQQQNLTDFDDRSGWRKFKDNATQVAGVGAAVLGAALLFTGVGTAAGAALIAGSAALGTFALGSTVADYTSGRNHVGLADVGLAAAGMIPGVGAGAARMGARIAEGVVAAGKASRSAQLLRSAGAAMDTAGKATTAGFVGYSGYDIGSKLASGQGIGTMDVLNLLAALGGAKHAGVTTRSSRPAPELVGEHPASSRYREYLPESVKARENDLYASLKAKNPDLRTSPKDILWIDTLPSGETAFLSRGTHHQDSGNIGAAHTLGRHWRQQFDQWEKPFDPATETRAQYAARMSTARAKLPETIRRALTEGEVVGLQGDNRPIYRVTDAGGVERTIAITVSKHGFIVGANPKTVRSKERRTLENALDRGERFPGRVATKTSGASAAPAATWLARLGERPTNAAGRHGVDNASPTVRPSKLGSLDEADSARLTQLAGRALEDLDVSVITNRFDLPDVLRRGEVPNAGARRHAFDGRDADTLDHRTSVERDLGTNADGATQYAGLYFSRNVRTSDGAEHLNLGQGSYGDHALELDPRVLWRSTITGRDSFDVNASNPNERPAHVEDLPRVIANRLADDLGSLSGRSDADIIAAIKHALTSAELNRRYFEVQIRGGFSLNDIREIRTGKEANQAGAQRPGNVRAHTQQLIRAWAAEHGVSYVEALPYFRINTYGGLELGQLGARLASGSSATHGTHALTAAGTTDPAIW